MYSHTATELLHIVKFPQLTHTLTHFFIQANVHLHRPVVVVERLAPPPPSPPVEPAPLSSPPGPPELAAPRHQSGTAVVETEGDGYIIWWGLNRGKVFKTVMKL